MLAIASIAVATRTLEQSGHLSAQPGRIALGWLVMQDLVAVMALVVVPAAAASGLADLPQALGRVVLELLGFGACVFGAAGAATRPRSQPRYPGRGAGA